MAVAGTTTALAIAGPAGAFELQPAADTYVDAARPRRAHGAAKVLRVGGAPRRRAYLRFELPALDPPPGRATLELHVGRRSGGRLRVRPLAAKATVSERRTTFARSPRAVRPVLRSAPVRPRRDVRVDVTGLIRSGRASLAIGGARAAALSSRESAHPPVLVVRPAPSGVFPPAPAAPPPFAGWPPPPPIAPPPIAGRPPSPPPAPPSPRLATLTIAQVVEPAGGSFRFATHGTGLEPFGLADGEQRRFALTSFGPKTITQQAAAGWSLAELSCTGDADAETDAATGHVSVDVGPGDAIHCRYRNQRDATVTVRHETEPETGAEFGFAGTFGDWSIGDGERTFTIAAGSFGPVTLTQLPAQDWTSAPPQCSGDAEAAAAGLTATLDVDPGERITCSFESRRHAGVTLVQDSDPDDGPAISYAGTLGELALEGDASHAFPAVTPDRFGPAVIAQHPVPGWAPSPPQCSGDADAVAGAHAVTLDIDAGEQIECRFGVRGPAPVPGIFPETSNFIGPFADGNGNLYTVTEASNTVFRPAIRRSEDGGRTWTEMDSANRPRMDDLESVSLVQDGTRVHMLHQRSRPFDVYYSSFNTSDAPERPDAWIARDEQVFAGADTATQPPDQCVSLVARRDGGLVGFYVIGPSEIAYRIKPPGGQWGAQAILDTAGAGRLLTQVLAERSTVDDTIHVAYQDHGRTSGVPSRILVRSLARDGTLSGPVTVATDAMSGSSGYKAMPNRGLAVRAGTGGDRLDVAWRRTDGRLAGAAVEGGRAQPAEVISDVPTYRNPPNVESNQIVAAMASDPGSGALAALYADDATHDLWSDVRAGGWGADVERLDDTDVMAISANVVTHGGGTVLGVLFDEETGVENEGAVRYVELEPSQVFGADRKSRASERIDPAWSSMRPSAGSSDSTGG